MRAAYLLVGILPAVSAFCDHGTTLNPRDEVVKVSEFNYDGLTGPLNWYALNETANAKCSLGKNQTPINIQPAALGSVRLVQGSSLTFDIPPYEDGAVLENLGSTLEVIAENGTLVVDGKKYSLKQYHVHTPSEHRIDDEHYPMEMHFVFQADDGALSVVGFPVEITAHNGSELLRSTFVRAQDAASPGTKTTTGPLSFARLAAHLAAAGVYQYGGSLTTPPCTEGVAWNVASEPIHVDVATYRRVKAVVRFNARYTQNAPGGTNLLENARDTLPGGGGGGGGGSGTKQ